MSPLFSRVSFAFNGSIGICCLLLFTRNYDAATLFLGELNLCFAMFAATRAFHRGDAQ